MEPAWDHNENEDKLLLDHTLLINRDSDMSTNMDITWVNTARGVCNNDNLSGGDVLNSLDIEYNNYLSTIVLNNVNYIRISDSSFLSFINSMLNIVIDRICLYSIWFKDFIFKIFNICSCDIKCKCTCKCENPCTKNTICICLCANSEGEGKECCICICKDKDNCKCVCICICKKGDKCCCKSGEHNCEECLVKVDIGTLRTDTSTIVYYLNCIRCYLSIIESKCCSCGCCQNGRCGLQCCSQCQPCTTSTKNTCCCCSCCPTGCNPRSCEPYCCCKDGKINYLGIISSIHWIELLFNQIGTNMDELRKFKNILSLISAIAKTCKKCCLSNTQFSGYRLLLLPIALGLSFVLSALSVKPGVDSSPNDSNKIECLIKNIQKAFHYYHLFGSVVPAIRMLVDYKTFFPQANEIIEKLNKSVKPLLNQLDEINTQIINYVYHDRMPNNLLISVMSRTVIDESIFFVSRLYIHHKIKSEIFKVLSMLEKCQCYKFYNKKFNNRRTGLTLGDATHVNDNPHLKLHINNKKYNEDNKLCLCLVVRYILLTDLYVVIRYNEYLYMDLLSYMSRSYKKYSYSMTHNFNSSKLIMLIITTLDKIIRWMRKKFIEDNSDVPYTIRCFCYHINNSYYGYLISIILYVSSLIENIWSMDTHNIRMATEKISIVLSEFQSTHIYTNYYSPLRFKIYTLVVDKQCHEKDKCVCKNGDQKCCCWCVTCFNLLVMLIYLCIQCKLCNAICNKSQQQNGCKKVKEYFKEMECKCTCQDKQNGLCCLLNLALSAGSGCEELKKVLEKCCTECTQGKDACCNKILEKVKAGECKLLLIGCCCNDANCGCTSDSGKIEGKCLIFKDLNECTSVAVVVFCKCKEQKCCCLTQLVEKLKPAFEKLFKNGCKDHDCCCKDLQNVCEELCCKGCEKEECVCKKLTDLCKSICGEISKGCNSGDNCLCKKLEEIKSCITNCVQGTCKCATKEGCCRCGCCKIVVQGVKLLTRACRANVLEPYKRITIELLGCSKDKPELIRKIINGINRTTLNNMYLVKNLYSSYPYSVGSYTETINGVTNVETRNWGYDTKYEHDVTNSYGFGHYNMGDGYPNLLNNPRTTSYSNRNVRSNKRFKIIISRMLVGGVIVFVFVYIRLTIVFF